MDLAEVADELYGSALADFMPTRTQRVKDAKAAGDKALAAEIGKLRKPSTAAWAVNMVMRDAPQEIERVLALGEALREAQQNLDGGELRELIKQRQALVGAMVERVRGVTHDLGHRISDPVATEVEQTFRAAMADADAAEAVRSRRLTVAISGSGLGGVDLSTVVASLPVAESVEDTAADESEADAVRRRRELAEARREAKEQEKAAEQAADDLDTAERAAAAAELDAADLRSKIDDLRKQLAAAEDDLGDAEQELDAARKVVAEATKMSTVARAAAHDAQADLERLEKAAE